MNLSSLATDAAAENAGIWITYDDARFLIAASGRPAFNRAMQRHARAIPQAKLRSDPAVQETVAIEAMADSVLLDFENVTMDAPGVPARQLDGKNRADRLTVLRNRTLRDWISTEAANIENFQKQEEKLEGES